jgi:hypothetical protein
MLIALIAQSPHPSRQQKAHWKNNELFNGISGFESKAALTGRQISMRNLSVYRVR